jgi:hypothetical protein
MKIVCFCFFLFFFFLFIYFCLELGVELRALPSLGKHCTTWTTLSVLLNFYFFKYFYACVFSSTKLVIRSEQDLPGTADGGRVAADGGAGQGGEMTQTIYAHVNKWIIFKNFYWDIIVLQRGSLWEFHVYLQWATIKFFPSISLLHHPLPFLKQFHLVSLFSFHTGA